MYISQINIYTHQVFLAGIAGSKSIGGFFAPASSSSTGMGPSPAKKICVIMDEVDGSTGNSDRGGIAELIKVIQKSKVIYSFVVCLD